LAAHVHLPVTDGLTADLEFAQPETRTNMISTDNRSVITKSERYREILAVLARHGIEIVDDEFIKHEAGNQARAEHLRLACEELGTIFVKIGQMLSTRSDLLPDAFRIELAKLQDEVASLPGNAIADVIQEDVGSPREKLLRFFDRKPLGSASIGQVHAARLFDGREWCSKCVNRESTNSFASTSRLWQASSTSGLRVFECLSNMTSVACFESSVTCYWLS
jgi:hypothetical protein